MVRDGPSSTERFAGRFEDLIGNWVCLGGCCSSSDGVVP